MARKRLLTFDKHNKQWKKVYQGRQLYLGKGKKTDQKSYLDALAEFYRRKAIIDGEPVPDGNNGTSNATLYGVLGKFIKSKHDERELDGKPSAARINSLESHLCDFVEELGIHAPVRSLDESAVTLYRSQKLKELRAGETSRTTIRDRFQATRQFIKWCWCQRWIDEEPRNISELSPPKAASAEIRVFSEDEVRELFDASSEPMQCYIALALNCGFTQQDIACLRVGDLCLETGRIARPRPKTGVPSDHKLWPVTMSLIERARTEREICGEDGKPFLFATRQGRPLVHDGHYNGRYRRSDSIRNRFNRLRAHLGWAGDSRGFSTLRKTGADLIKKLTADPVLVDKFLAHSARRMADQYYVRPEVELLDNAIEQLGLHLGLGGFSLVEAA